MLHRVKHYTSSLSDFGNVGCNLRQTGPFFPAFLPHSWAMGLRMRKKLSSVFANLASTPKVRQAAGMIACENRQQRVPCAIAAAAALEAVKAKEAR